MSVLKKDAVTDLVEEIFSYKFDEFPRIQRLKSEMMNARMAVALQRSSLLTDYFEKNGFDLKRPLYRQAASLNHILSNMDATIFPEELIVGSASEHRFGSMMFPEFQAAIIWPEMLKLPHRKKNPVDISAKAIEEFSFRIFPYFKDKNILQWAKTRFGYPESLKLMERLMFYLVAHPYGVSHVIPNYRVAIELGFNRVKEIARDKLGQVTGLDEVSARAREFYEAIEIVSDGVIAFARNYSAKCAALSKSESDPKRKAELVELARILDRVPAEPAATFWEALEAMWITHVAVLQENSDMALSFGRTDQFLQPYYAKDVAEGRIDARRAIELLMAFYVKTNDHAPLVPEAAENLLGGAATNQSITIGGQDAHGRDVVNDLSYLHLRALDLARLREPNVDARFHPGSPKLWYTKVLEVVRSTGATPALYNDEAIVPALMSKGVSLEDARDYGVIGCVETTAQGKTYGMTGSIMINLSAVLEMTMNGGFHRLPHLQIGPVTKKFGECKTFDEVWSVFLTQLNFIVDQSVETEQLFDRTHAEYHPIPLMSALMDGPMEKGRDVTAGGAVYNSSGTWIVGYADVVDSLAAIKKLVFDEKRIGADELIAALDADFVGYDKVHALLLNRAPKFGNDDPDADEIATRVADEIDRAFNKHTNYRGGPYLMGYYTITFHVGYGRLTGALPNGRKKGMPLASGATPVSGASRKGPSASLSSTAKLPPHALGNCIANNHKIPLSLLNEPGKMDVMEQLVRGFFKKQGMQVQFVVSDKKVLLEAMENPALAKDLLVRVSGYTAYFGDLDKDMQREIINRTEDLI